MSDLSKLLGDVYGSTTTEADGDEQTEHQTEEHTEAPDWADEDLLDRAFDGWVAGPPDEASATERSMLSPADEAPPAPPEPNEARVEQISRIVPLESVTRPPEAPEAAVTQVAEEPVAVDAPVEPGRGWDRSRDDILPRRSGPRGLLRRR